MFTVYPNSTRDRTLCEICREARSFPNRADNSRITRLLDSSDIVDDVKTSLRILDLPRNEKNVTF
jgi:hypothetical protein